MSYESKLPDYGIKYECPKCGARFHSYMTDEEKARDDVAAFAKYHQKSHADYEKTLRRIKA